MPERIDFWGIPFTWGSPAIYVYFLMALGSIILIFRFYQRARLWWRVGRPDVRWNRIHIRLWRVFQYAIVQAKLLRQKYPGLMHIGLAWGFFTFFLGTALATIDSHFLKILQGNFYLVYKFVLDSFTILFLIGAGMAAYRRFLQRPPRLTLEPRFTWSLVLITLIVMGGWVTESLRLAVEQPAWKLWSPFGWLLAQAWIATGASGAALLNWHLGLWIFHLLLVTFTIATLPVGTLLHVLTSPLNVFFSKLDRVTGKLAPIPQTAKGEPIYASTLRDLTWKQLLDGDACTECGRCQDACPAFAAGKPLSPKQVVLGVRVALQQDGRLLFNNENKAPLLATGNLSAEVVWSCTTCGACVCECPVLIEHVDTIVDFRRHLVIEGQMDTELQGALENLGRYGNSFGQSERMRARWTQPIQPVVKDARREPVEYLWFVGDYASYSPTLTEITVKTAEVFRKIGLDFGILYDAERNAGNDVRRVGEEGLFEMLMEKNSAVLGKCTYQAIVTTDPHSYNTLKNEYPINGEKPLPVFHYTELLDMLIASGRLKFSKKLGYKVTYHDACYLGRYNGIYEAPRRVIKATGCELVEMPRHNDGSFCCGAGGGRIWMAEGEIKERPSESRIREAVKLGNVSALVVACPKDVTMFRDAVKTTGNEQHLEVRDLIELVHAAL
jgi:Fe-S oxidoreductase